LAHFGTSPVDRRMRRCTLVRESGRRSGLAFRPLVLAVDGGAPTGHSLADVDILGELEQAKPASIRIC